MRLAAALSGRIRTFFNPGIVPERHGKTHARLSARFGHYTGLRATTAAAWNRGFLPPLFLGGSLVHGRTHQVVMSPCSDLTACTSLI